MRRECHISVTMFPWLHAGVTLHDSLHLPSEVVLLRAKMYAQGSMLITVNWLVTRAACR